MQSRIYDIIAVLAEDIKANMPDSFEKRYYEKMAYSGENKIFKLKKDLL